MEQQLIALYLHVCRAYDTQPNLKYQRLSNFRPRFTDEELLTVYLFGHMQGFYQQRRIYEYVRRHWRAWFPHLPSYQAFNRRMNRLAPAFEQLITASLAAPVEQLKAAAARGEALFKGKATCAQCHVPPLFTEPGWNTYKASEIGIDDFQASRSPDDSYRTVPLRGLFTHTKGGFYHDGRFATLLDVVNHYDKFKKLNLAEQEKNDLVEFLKSL